MEIKNKNKKWFFSKKKSSQRGLSDNKTQKEVQHLQLSGPGTMEPDVRKSQIFIGVL